MKNSGQMNKNQEKVLTQMIEILIMRGKHGDPYITFDGSVTSGRLEWAKENDPYTTYPMGTGPGTLKSLIKNGLVIAHSEEYRPLLPSFDVPKDPTKEVNSYMNKDWEKSKKVVDTFWELEGETTRNHYRRGDRIVTKVKISKLGEAVLRGEMEGWQDLIS